VQRMSGDPDDLYLSMDVQIPPKLDLWNFKKHPRVKQHHRMSDAPGDDQDEFYEMNIAQDMTSPQWIEMAQTLNRKRSRISSPGVSPSTFSEDGDNFTFDVCMVFKPGSQSDAIPELTAVEIVEALNRAKLRTKLFKSVEEDMVYCLIGASEGRLEKEAERIDYELLLDAEQTVLHAARQGVIKIQTGFRISDWRNLYARFNPQVRKLYVKHNCDGYHHRNSVFRGVDRIKLTISIIESEKKLGGAALSISKLLKMRHTHLFAFFALHDYDKLAALEKKWFAWKSILSQPLNEVRDYFGEEIGLYFGFLRNIGLCTLL